MRQFFGRVAGVAALKALGAVLLFLLNVVVSRLFPPDDAGLFFLSLSIVNIAVIVALLGFDGTLLRLVSGALSMERTDEISGASRRGTFVVVVWSLLIAAALFLAARPLSELVFHKQGLDKVLSLMALGIVPIALYTVYGELLRATRRVLISVVIQFILLPAMLLILIFSAGRSGGIDLVAGLYLLCAVVIAVIGFSLWRKAFTQKTLSAEPSLRKMFSIALPIYWVSVAGMVLGWADTIILGMWVPSEGVATYNAAARVAQMGAFILTSVNFVIAPQIAAVYAQGDMASLSKLVNRAWKLTVLSGFLIVSVIFIWPNLVLGLFGSGYLDADAALRILLVGQLINAATGPVGIVLIMTKYERILSYLVVGAAILDVVLNSVLVPIFSLNGAAVGTAVSLAALNLTCLWVVKRKLGIAVYSAKYRHAELPMNSSILADKR